MAVTAAIFYSDNLFALDLYPDEPRERVGDAAPEDRFGPESPIWFKWDAEKLERDEREFVGLKVFGLDRLTDRDLRSLDEMQLPRVSCPEAGIADQPIPAVLRWARQTFRGVEPRIAGWTASVPR